MEEYQNKVQACIHAIKQEIRTQDITYQQLADKLGVSLLTVKRQLNAGDLSMSKLLALCDAAGIEFTEIWESIGQDKPVHTIISPEQDEAFFKYPHLMSFFFALFLGKYTPAQIKKRFELSDASMHLYLRKLEMLELISLSTTQKVSFKIKAPIGFSGNSKILSQELTLALDKLNDKLKADTSEDLFLIVKPLQLSPSLKDKMQGELVDLVSRYAELSERYFVAPENETFCLVVCEYDPPDRSKFAPIINVNGFD